MCFGGVTWRVVKLHTQKFPPYNCFEVQLTGQLQLSPNETITQHVASRGDNASLEPVRNIVVQLLKANTAKPKDALGTVEKRGSRVHMQFCIQEIKALTVTARAPEVIT
jgi:hypothetical protein